MTAMRIALITPEYPQCGPSFGVGRYVSDLAACLAEAGATVLVLASTDLGNFIIRPGQDPQPAGPGQRRLLLRPLLAAPWLNRELAGFAPDIVDVPNWGGLGAFLRLACPCVVRLVTSASDPSLAHGDRLLPLRMLLERLTVRRATRLVSDSAAMAEVSRRIYARMPDEVIHLAYRGPIAPLAPRPAPAVLFVGRLEKRKGIDILLDAWPAARAVLPDAHLHVVGPDKGGFGERVANTPGVTWHGFADDATLTGLRASCRVQVIPSRFESFGLVALEAWAAGMAVVASDAGSLPAIVGEAGIIAASENSPALAEALLQALETERATELACLGQRRLHEYFQEDRLAQRSLALYRLAIDDHDR
jgi:glycosyltransferase involved in cell wall biosynthesis